MTPRRLGWVGAAAIAAGVAGWAGPADWTAGSGRLTLAIDGVERASAAVEVGGSAPVRLASPDGAAALDLPGGVPLSGVVQGRVALADPDVARVQVALTLPDGRVTALPATEVGDGGVKVRRQPVRDANVVLGLLAGVAVLWISEAMPMFVASLLVPVVLVAFGTAEAQPALAPFFHPVIALFLGGFLLAECITDTGLDKRAATAVVRALGRSPVVLYAGMLGLAAFLSMWMSNTATCAVLIPVALAVTAPLPEPAYRKALILGLAWASSIGGIGSPVGTAPNAIAAAFVESLGRPIGFWTWFAFGLPLVALVLPGMAAWLWWSAGVRLGPGEFGAVVRRASEQDPGPLTDRELQVLAVFGLLVLGWLSEPLHGVASGIVALGGVIALGALGRVDAPALGRISWESLITFGGGLSLGAAMVSSGASDALAVGMAGLRDLPPGVGVFAVAAVTLALTAVASNTASAAVLIPVAHALAGALGVDPVTLVMVVALASSLDFALVIGTPPTMMAYSTGLFDAAEIFRIGLVVDLIGLVALVAVVVPIWGVLGL